MWKCWKENCGISIDTHMERTFFRLKWSSNKKREKQTKELESFLPKGKLSIRSFLTKS